MNGMVRVWICVYMRRAIERTCFIFFIFIQFRFVPLSFYRLPLVSPSFRCCLCLPQSSPSVSTVERARNICKNAIANVLKRVTLKHIKVKHKKKKKKKSNSVVNRLKNKSHNNERLTTTIHGDSERRRISNRRRRRRRSTESQYTYTWNAIKKSTVKWHDRITAIESNTNKILMNYINPFLNSRPLRPCPSSLCKALTTLYCDSVYFESAELSLLLAAASVAVIDVTPFHSRIPSQSNVDLMIVLSIAKFKSSEEANQKEERETKN